MPIARRSRYQPPDCQPPGFQISLTMRRLVAGLVFCAVFSCVARAQAIKTWSFPVQRGTVSVSLLHGAGDRLVLSLGSLPCGACATMPEMRRLLGDVLSQMRAGGSDPRRLTMIETRVSEPEAQRALAEAALRSPESSVRSS